MNEWLAPQLLQGSYIAILLLIMVVDLRWRRVLNALSLPGTALALLAGWLAGREAFLLALSGALLGFGLFLALSWAGRRAYGTAVLGFGDVKLAMLLGAMLGLQQILPALALGLLLAGGGSLALLLTRRARRDSMVPYGAFLAAAGIVVLLGGRF